MSSIVEALAAELQPKLEQEAGKAQVSLADMVDAKIPGLPSWIQGIAAAGSTALRNNAPAIAKHGAKLFTAMVVHVTLGTQDEAIRKWIGTASPDAVLAKLNADAAAVQAKNRNRQELYDDLKEAAMDFVQAVGSFGLPILLHVVGL